MQKLDPESIQREENTLTHISDKIQRTELLSGFTKQLWKLTEEIPLKLWGKNDSQLRILYPVKMSIKAENRMKSYMQDFNIVTSHSFLR